MDKDDVSKMIAEVNHQRSLLEDVGNMLATRVSCSEIGSKARLDPYCSLLVSAEANLYRACVQLKEAYRQWERIKPVIDGVEYSVFVESSPFLERSQSSLRGVAG